MVSCSTSVHLFLDIIKCKTCDDHVPLTTFRTINNIYCFVVYRSSSSSSFFPLVKMYNSLHLACVRDDLFTTYANTKQFLNKVTILTANAVQRVQIEKVHKFSQVTTISVHTELYFI